MKHVIIAAVLLAFSPVFAVGHNEYCQCPDCLARQAKRRVPVLRPLGVYKTRYVKTKRFTMSVEFELYLVKRIDNQTGLFVIGQSVKTKRPAERPAPPPEIKIDRLMRMGERVKLPQPKPPEDNTFETVCGTSVIVVKRFDFSLPCTDRTYDLPKNKVLLRHKPNHTMDGNEYAVYTMENL